MIPKDLMIYRKDNIMTTDACLTMIYNHVRNTKYASLTSALAQVLIGGASATLISSISNIAYVDFVRAMNLIKKTIIVEKDIAMESKSFKDIHDSHAFEVEDIRQVLMDNNFSYLPIDAQLYLYAQIKDYSLEELTRKYNCKPHIIMRKIATAIYSYFEQYGMPQPCYFT